VKKTDDITENIEK